MQPILLLIFCTLALAVILFRQSKDLRSFEMAPTCVILNRSQTFGLNPLFGVVQLIYFFSVLICGNARNCYVYLQSVYKKPVKHGAWECHLIAFGFDDVCFICCCHSNHTDVRSSSFGSSLFNTDLKISLCSEDTQTPSSFINLDIVADNFATYFSACHFAFCVFCNRITNS